MRVGAFAMKKEKATYRLWFHGSNQIVENPVFNGTISRSDFWVLIRFRYPTHQLVICKEAALDYLSFKEGNEIHE